MRAAAPAIPAFARRYETACSTCHVQFPNLNAFGEAFRRNGYQFPAGGDAEAIKQTPMTLVSDARRELFPRSDWPTDLARFPPLALVLDGLVPMFPDASPRPAASRRCRSTRSSRRRRCSLGARAGDHVAVFACVTFLSTPRSSSSAGSSSSRTGRPTACSTFASGQFEPQILSFSSYRRIGGPST